MNLQTLQLEARAWRTRNFKDTSTAMHQTLGVCEEAGELAHAVLKMEQGIRGDRTEHLEEAADAVADIVIYLTGVCDNLGLDFQRCVEETWSSVKQRDWVANPVDGS